MAARPMTGKRLTNNTSIPNRKVAPANSDVAIHPFKIDDQKSIVSKNFKEEKLTAGMRAAGNYDYVEAVKQFSLIKPDTTTSLYLGGCARLELKHYTQTQEAITDFTKCFELSSQTERPPFYLELWYKRASAFSDVNKHDHAIKDYNEFIHRCRLLAEQGKPDLHRGLIGRGLTYQAMYEFNTAMKDIDEANKLTTNSNPYYLCCRASVYVSKNEPNKAMEDLENAVDAECDQDTEALIQRSIVLADLGRYNAALEDLKKALKIDCKPTEQSEICFRCGLNEYALNNKEDAYQWFKQAITLHPFHAQAYYYLGILQAEKGQFKDALQTLTRAHELSPEAGNILLERATVNQHLGKLDDAAQDRKHGMQLNLSSFTIITKLGERIRKLREEMHRTGTSAHNHLELAMAYDGILSHKKTIQSKMEYYKEAVDEYRAAIEMDTKDLYPQARALLVLCRQKMNDLIEAHELHLDFYNILSEHKGAEYHWKTYLLDVKTKMEAGQLEPHLDENAVSRLLQMEINRRKKEVDLETFENDIQDKYNNQLTFYERFHIDLSNVLAAIAVLNLDSDSIIHNAEGKSNQVSKIVALLSENETSVPEIESVLNSSSKVSKKTLQKVNYDIVKMKLTAIGNVGDIADQLDVAQLVARHLCTRYRSQFICLKPSNYQTDDEESLQEESKPWWKCCGRPKWFSSKSSTSSDENEIIEKIATFAIAFIIHAINSETIRVSSNRKSTRKDALATTLVLLVSRAQASPDTGFLSSLRHGTGNLPVDLTAVTKMLENSRPSNADENEVISTIEWNLYEFFRAPGIYYHVDGNTGKIRYYHSAALMIPSTYGYRLGTREEVDVFKALNRKQT